MEYIRKWCTDYLFTRPRLRSKCQLYSTLIEKSSIWHSRKSTVCWSRRWVPRLLSACMAQYSQEAWATRFRWCRNPQQNDLCAANWSFKICGPRYPGSYHLHSLPPCSIWRRHSGCIRVPISYSHRVLSLQEILPDLHCQLSLSNQRDWVIPLYWR